MSLFFLRTSKQANRTTNDNRQFAVQDSLRRAAWFAFGAAAIAAFLTSATLLEVTRQANTMKDTLTEVQTQTKLMRQQLVGSQSAALEFTIGFNGGPSHLGISFRNGGHVAAKDVHVRVEASRGKLPNATPDGPAVTFLSGVPVIAVAGQYNKQWLLPWQPPEFGVGVLHSWPKGWPGTATYIFRGEYTYENGFGDVVRQGFCQAWLPTFTIVYKTQTSASGGGLVACDDLKGAIDSTLEQERQAERGAGSPQ